MESFYWVIDDRLMCVFPFWGEQQTSAGYDIGPFVPLGRVEWVSVISKLVIDLRVFGYLILFESLSF